MDDLDSFNIMDASTPVDVNLCLMMFLGTLHKGMVSDRRLMLLCRIGFLVVVVSHAPTYIIILYDDRLRYFLFIRRENDGWFNDGINNL